MAHQVSSFLLWPWRCWVTGQSWVFKDKLHLDMVSEAAGSQPLAAKGCHREGVRQLVLAKPGSPPLMSRRAIPHLPPPCQEGSKRVNLRVFCHPRSQVTEGLHQLGVLSSLVLLYLSCVPFLLLPLMKKS